MRTEAVPALAPESSAPAPEEALPDVETVPIDALLALELSPPEDVECELHAQR
jgi:hypothetical protein